jgi:acetyltransferase-like isoleucine patch superfamily enzyme
MLMRPLLSPDMLHHVDPSVRVNDYAVIGRIPTRSPALARMPDGSGDLVIGRETEIGCFAVIYAHVRIGAECMIGDGANIREGCRLGDRCLIGRNVTINYNAWLGDRVRVMDGAHITGGVTIGDDTFIGVNVTTSNDRGIDPSDYIFDSDRLKPPIIGRGVMIGSGANILPGVTIGDGAVIGAGALVMRDVPAGARLLAVTPRQVGIA